MTHATHADAEMVEQIRSIITAEGSVYGASRRLGIPRATLTSIAAGAPVRPGTLALARERLREFAPPVAGGLR